MASRKSYSRYFIILQEDEKGYALDRDKSSSGYVKLEKKNNKCKVSFYAQNINPGMEPYYMVLVCKEKNAKKLLVLGKLSISEQGKIDMSCEYDIDNIADTKMSMQHIIGATVSKVIEKDIVSLMSGFMGSDIPKDWKKYELVKITRKDEVVEKEETKNVEPENTKEDSKVEQEEKFEEQKKQEFSRDTFDEYEKKIEENVKEEEIQGLPKEQLRNKAKSNDSTNQDESDKNEILSKEETERIEVKETEVEEKETEKTKVEKTEIEEIERIDTKEKEVEKKETEKIETEETLNRQRKEQVLEKKENLERSDEVIDEKAELEDNISYKDNEFCSRYIEEFMEEPQMDFRYDENSEYYSFEDMLRKKKKCCCKKCTYEEMPIGRLGSYFKGLISCFDEIKDMGEEIPMCKWYKVPVEKLEDMYDCSDFDRYTIIYYPMICYYSYINQHKHYCIGYKCNKEGKLLYIIYAIPGGKDRMCQPYGGRTGFVTWIPYKSEERGYWLMFYDFRKSSVVVPIRKK